MARQKPSIGTLVMFWTCIGFGAALAAGGAAIMQTNEAGIAVVIFGGLFIGAGFLSRWVFGRPLMPPMGPIGPGDAADIEANAAAATVRLFRQRPDWVEGRVVREGVRDDRRRRAITGFWLGATLISLVAVILWGKAAWGFLFVTGLISGLMVFVLAQERIRRRKFGETLFVMEETPARLGGTLRGVVQTGMAPGQRPSEGFRVRLRCYQVWQERQTMRIGGSTRSVRKEKTTWETETVAWPEAGAGGGVEAAIRIDLPEDAPPSMHSDMRSGVFWRLRVDASAEGVNFDARFLIPVLEKYAQT